MQSWRQGEVPAEHGHGADTVKLEVDCVTGDSATNSVTSWLHARDAVHSGKWVRPALVKRSTLGWLWTSWRKTTPHSGSGLRGISLVFKLWQLWAEILKRWCVRWKGIFSYGKFLFQPEKPIFWPEKPTCHLKKVLFNSILPFRIRLLFYVLGLARSLWVHYCNILNRHKHKIFSLVENSGRLPRLSNFLSLWQNTKSGKIHTNKQMMDQKFSFNERFLLLVSPININSLTCGIHNIFPDTWWW